MKLIAQINTNITRNVYIFVKSAKLFCILYFLATKAFIDMPNVRFAVICAMGLMKTLVNL